MSYIEQKYNNKISEVFDDLTKLEQEILKLFNFKSIKYSEKVAKLCALSNKSINLILKKYYPEIKRIDDKLRIKSRLKFYYDLLDKLTHFIRSVEEFQKVDDQYYDAIIDFINEKELLISGKYTRICSHELTVFYDKKSRENLERILTEKIEKKNWEFFAMGPLEQEIKKIAKIAGANQVSINVINGSYKQKLESELSIIKYTVLDNNKQELLLKIGEELRNYLESKKYQVVVKPGIIITNAKLVPDDITKSNK